MFWKVQWPSLPVSSGLLTQNCSRKRSKKMTENVTKQKSKGPSLIVQVKALRGLSVCPAVTIINYLKIAH